MKTPPIQQPRMIQRRHPRHAIVAAITGHLHDAWAVAIVGLLATVPLQAQNTSPRDLIVCDFNEPAGNPLPDTQTRYATQGIMPPEAYRGWNDNFLNGATDGSGRYVITRAPDGPSNIYLSLADMDAEAGPLYLETVIHSYHTDGAKAYERFNIGFAENNHATAPKIVAQFTLDRLDSDTVELYLLALGEGATKPKHPRAKLPTESKQPITIVVKYDPARQTYEGSFRFGDGPWQWLGEARTDRDRAAWYVRFRCTGRWNSSEEEHLAIDSIRLTRDDPRRTTATRGNAPTTPETAH